MVSEVTAVAPQTMEVPMVEAEAVRQMRDLAAKGWGAKRIARELGLARNTVRRYLRGGVEAEVQRHPSQQRLDEVRRGEAVALFEGEAEGNAVVVAQMLAERETWRCSFSTVACTDVSCSPSLASDSLCCRIVSD